MRRKVFPVVGFVVGLLAAWYAPNLLRGTKRIEFSSEALEDARQAVVHCDEAKPGLGGWFVRDLTGVLRLIQADPKQHEAAGTAKGAVLNRFPYEVEFRVDHDRVRITAVRHQPWRAASWPGVGGR